MKTLAQARAEYVEWLKDPKARALESVRWGTGFMRRAAGDPALNGCSEIGSLIVVGGWPGTGKSMFGLRELAYLPGKSLYLSFEDSEREVSKRGAIIDTDQQEQITLITDPRLATLPAIEDAVREFRTDIADDGPFVVLVDYIQLLSLGQQTQMQRTQEIGQIVGRLRALGREEACVFILNAHLQRPQKPQKRKGQDDDEGPPRPRMSDLGDSKSLEGGADAVLLLYPTGDNTLEVYNVKHKHGPAGARKLFRRDPDSGWLEEVLGDH
jgi:replicative DNA helicase